MLKLLVIFAIAALVVVKTKSLCLGCQEPLDFQDAKHILQASLAKLSTLNGFQYRSGKIHSATQQVAAGITYRINADMIDATNNRVVACDVKIQKQSVQLGNTQVAIDCPNQMEIIRTYIN